jgi:hypothetical protein
VFVERDAGLALDAIRSVRLDGSGRARISPDVPLAKLGGFLVTADGARVVFRSDADSDGRYRLFSAPADGSAAAIPIDGTPIDPALADVRSFKLTAGGTIDIFSHLLGSGGKQVLNGLLQAENVLAETGPNMPIVVSPNGNHVLFAMRSTTWPTHLTELYLAPVGGWPSNNGVPDFLGYDQPTGGRIEFSPDSNWIVYRSGSELVSRSTSGENGPCAISQSAMSPNQGLGYLVDVLDFAIHPDSQCTAYSAPLSDVWSTALPLFENGFECGTAPWSSPAVDPCLIQLP